MTNADFFSKLETLADITLAGGATDSDVRQLSAHADLPEVHCDFLRVSDGLSLYGGYFRIFGCSSALTIDMSEWNSRELWLFAWDASLGQYWFFGETAWGDQYAYKRSDLGQSADPPVYFLEGITMKPEVIAENFQTFLTTEMLQNSIDPYDTFLVAARQRLGDICPREHIAYIPSPLVSGEEDIDSISKIDAVASMIINGDLCSQLANNTTDRPIQEIQTYQDENGRMRIKVVWSC